MTEAQTYPRKNRIEKKAPNVQSRPKASKSEAGLRPLRDGKQAYQKKGPLRYGGCTITPKASRTITRNSTKRTGLLLQPRLFSGQQKATAFLQPAGKLQTRKSVRRPGLRNRYGGVGKDYAQ
jgi:hypothetical protein